MKQMIIKFCLWLLSKTNYVNNELENALSDIKTLQDRLQQTIDHLSKTERKLVDSELNQLELYDKLSTAEYDNLRLSRELTKHTSSFKAFDKSPVLVSEVKLCAQPSEEVAKTDAANDLVIAAHMKSGDQLTKTETELLEKKIASRKITGEALKLQDEFFSAETPPIEKKKNKSRKGSLTEKPKVEPEVVTPKPNNKRRGRRKPENNK